MDINSKYLFENKHNYCTYYDKFSRVNMNVVEASVKLGRFPKVGKLSRNIW